MKTLCVAALAIGSLTAGAQTTTNFNQIPHIETALNHLTVVDLGEPVVRLAVADQDAFQIKWQDDKVFVMPLREGIATNLFIWTATRQLSYEIDPAGDLAKMNVIIRNGPPASPHGTSQSAAVVEPSDQEIQKIASLVLTQALMGSEDIFREGSQASNSHVVVDLEQVFRSKNEIYIRYTITNLSKSPFRITKPDVYEPQPTQQPISLLSLRDHQLSPQTFAAFKAKPGQSVDVISAQIQKSDLLPGQKSTGIVGVKSAPGNPPQLFQLHFGDIQGGPILAQAVL